MIVVSDATPLHTLIQLELSEILATLYQRIVIPSAVERELSHAHAPKEVRDWLVSPPYWLAVQSPSRVDPDLVSGEGEREAISLALELKADLLLVDDKEARAVARRLKLAITGTIGVLELASATGLIDLRWALEHLPKVGFYTDDEIVQQVLERTARRRV